MLTRLIVDVTVRPGVTPHGVGLIAVRAINQGEHIAPCSADMTARRLAASRQAKLPEGVAQVITDLYDGHAPLDYQAGIPLACLLNHSTCANSTFDPENHSIVAARLINAGEEVTVNYLEYLDCKSPMRERARRGFGNEVLHTTTPPQPGQTT